MNETVAGVLSCLVVVLTVGFAIKAGRMAKTEQMTLRVSANTVDLVVVSILCYVITYICDQLTCAWFRLGHRETTLLIMTAQGLAVILYNIIFLGVAGATPGKMLLGLQVLRKDFKKLSWLNAILRNVFTLGLWAFYLYNAYTGYRPTDAPDSFWRYMTWVAMETFALMFVISIIDYSFTGNPQKRSLHDMIGGTLVVERKKSPKA